ncbi:leucine--tRNA ligase [Candidatus Margulisiibacteriota bacterium]
MNRLVGKMNKEYRLLDVEKKWQDFWDKNKTYKCAEDAAYPKKKRFYCLDMFPYPSGAGLHVGHPEGYTASDILSRYKRMKGFNVLHPMGWDAFGLPAENYAIKTGTHPKTCTEQNISNFKRQIKSIGFSYDWDREIDTTDPEYFKWTQWIFLKLFEKGLAYEATVPINWCPSCKTGLANEEVSDGKCHRCSSEITKKDIRQWMLKITAYADRLLDDLEKLDWPEAIKIMQRNWIGKSIGAEVDFKVDGFKEVIRVFTTRPDTLFGATYMVLAPEHPMVLEITTEEHADEVQKYIEKAHQKSDLEREHLLKSKSGVFTGAYAVNPVNNEKIPVWISDYVLLTYGTGAIMSVPAHDERDFEFATKFKLPIIQVVSKDGKPYELKEAYVEEGIAINSGKYNGLKTAEFTKKVTADLEKKKQGKKTINYKLRDWVFSRQRYWGEPIPVVHCKKCGVVALPESDLPLKLPEVKKYEPTGTGKSPLANIEKWVKTKCPKCNAPAERETNTMPQWAGSNWYFLRYIDPKNNKALADKEKIKYWMPVDHYIGGAEHAVLHLLYSRFWYKFLYDIKVVPNDEPFQKLTNQGLILAEDGQKMSKSLGNVVNPDEVIKQHGADAFRMYEMFMGPLEAAKPWSMQGILGIRRFLDKVWNLYEKKIEGELPKNINALMHKTIKKVGEDIEDLRFNTAISAMMILVNECGPIGSLSKELAKDLLLILAPFAPHVTEELWEKIGEKPSIHKQSFPAFDPKLIVEEELTIPIQVSGKLRDTIKVSAGESEKKIKELAQASEKVKKFLEGKQIVKIIYIPKRLVNIVAK